MAQLVASIFMLALISVSLAYYLFALLSVALFRTGAVDEQRYVTPPQHPVLSVSAT
jgi:hypothetical protein